jgi:riboflavin kinase/FMN adenylyltransferase
VEFVRKVRDEQTFDSLDALKAQIANDIRLARSWFEEVADD